jgi:hypothetical protein
LRERELASVQRDAATAGLAGVISASSAGELGNGRRVERAGLAGRFERQHVGYRHSPCARVQQLADTKARALEDVAGLLNGDRSGGVSDDRSELAL